ncbi:MAG: DUF1924 domain-containing protein [SAR324 cluster bacterium]|nr:DUF1924 domain-containing protein [SAR324 cluster bacterium]
MKLKTVVLITTAILFFQSNLFAAAKMNPVVTAYLNKLAEKQKKKDPSFVWFSAEEGKTLYFKEHLHSKKNKIRNCATCHKKDPTFPAAHADTGKKIKPLAPSVNSKRFTKRKKMNKWFRRNCKWVLERQCTNKEKGDFLVWMFSL